MSKWIKPKCPCGGEVVLSSAGGKDFWYCRGCKKEVVDKIHYGNESKVSLNQEELDKAIQDALNNIGNILNPTSYMPPVGPQIPTTTISPPLSHQWAITHDICTVCAITGIESIKFNVPYCSGTAKFWSSP